MQTQNQPPVTAHAVPGPLRGVNALSPPQLAGGDVSTGIEQNDRPDEGHLLGFMDFDMNSLSSVPEQTFAEMMQSIINGDTVIYAPVEHTNQLEQDQTDNNLINLELAFPEPGIGNSSQLPSSEALPAHPDMVSTIRPEQSSYGCSWCHGGSDTTCDHVAPDRLAFLRHLGGAHQVSGAQSETITCQLLNSKTGVPCKKSVKRGNFPRHVDIHYPLHYQCQHCPTSKSFSRQDSWKKHVKTEHAHAPPAL